MNNLSSSDVWKEALSRLGPEIGEDNVALWLRSVEPVALEDRLLRIKVPNAFFPDHIRKHYQTKIERALKDVSGRELTLDYVISKESPPAAVPYSSPAENPPQSEFSFGELNPRYTFEAFVVGDSNRFAHATAGAISKNPGKQFNPFFIYGGVGLGKTHLMHAIGHELLRSRARSRVLYTTSEQFVNEFINSMRDGKPDTFRNKYRNLDCFLIDDIQFLVGKDRSEEEFFHTFNALLDGRKQIIISSDRAPKEMAPSEQRLISRFEWGVVADIKPPNLETRIAILRKKAETEQLSIPDDIILFIAGAIKTNIRELEGSLTRLGAYSSLTGAQLTVDIAKEVLKDSIVSDSLSPVRIETIQKIISRKYSLDVKDLKSPSRTNDVAFARQVAMYLACKLTELSTTDIGKAFGGRDHTTVIHARKKIAELLEREFLLVEQVNKLTEEIRSLENS